VFAKGSIYFSQSTDFNCGTQTANTKHLYIPIQEASDAPEKETAKTEVFIQSYDNFIIIFFPPA